MRRVPELFSEVEVDWAAVCVAVCDVEPGMCVLKILVVVCTHKNAGLINGDSPGDEEVEGVRVW